MKKWLLPAAIGALTLAAGGAAMAQPYGYYGRHYDGYAGRGYYRDSDRDGVPDRREWNRDRDRDGRPDQWDRYDNRRRHHHYRSYGYRYDRPYYGYDRRWGYRY